MPNEVESVRRSDLVEVLPELMRFGTPRSWLKRQLWVPRAGFWPALLAILRTHWRRMLPGMFQAAGTPAVVSCGLTTTTLRVRQGALPVLLRQRRGHSLDAAVNSGS